MDGSVRAEPRPGVAAFNYALAALFALTGIVSTLALVAYAVSGSDLAPLPVLHPIGRFLADAFLWVAPLIPLLLLTFSFLSVAPRISDRMVIALAPAGLVVLTLAAIAQLAAAAHGTAVTTLLTSTFGYLQSQILLLLALALEVLVTIAMVQRAKAQTSASRAAALITDGSEIVELPEIGDYLTPGQFDHVAELEAEPEAPVAATAAGAEDGTASPEPLLPSKPPDATVAPAMRNSAQLLPLPPLQLPALAAPAALDRRASTGRALATAPFPNDLRRDSEADEPSEVSGETREVARMRAFVTSARTRHYSVPVEGVLDDYRAEQYWKIDRETEEAGEVLMATLAEFSIEAEVTGIRRGPVITMFEILPAPGVKISRIVNLADNIALRLAASSVRIVAPIPGKHAVGIEVPNRSRAIVSFKEMVSQPAFTDGEAAVPVALGKDIAGEAKIVDLTATPHLLIAGATGSGKSVCVNSIICSVLYSRTPSEVRLLLIDPKIVELKFYNDVPHLLTPVITEPRRAFQALQYCLCEMERRYALLDAFGVRDIRSYNAKAHNAQATAGADAGRANALPYLVIVIDEFADLMASTGKELESTLARLAAMSRAVGIHLVLATQRPSIEVITGLIKANIPSRIAFMVAGKFDSRIIIDTVGAEKLLGKGDMLFAPAWDSNPERIQGAFLSEHEVGRVVDYVRTLGEPNYVDEELLFDDEAETAMTFGDGDPLMEQALEIVVGAGKASASYLQRKLKIGYNRAARLVEEMEARGIVGPPNGSKPRDLLHIPSREPATAAEHP